MPTTTAAYAATFRGEADQIRSVRHEVARYLAGCPAADDVVQVLSEYATNAILHSRSRHDEFIVRCERFEDYVWLEVEDMGGPWHSHQLDGRPHGLDIVHALAGDSNWGVDRASDGHRIAWARLDVTAEIAP